MAAGSKITAWQCLDNNMVTLRHPAPGKMTSEGIQLLCIEVILQEKLLEPSGLCFLQGEV